MKENIVKAFNLGNTHTPLTREEKQENEKIILKHFVPDNTPLTEEENGAQKLHLASLGNFAHSHPIKKDFWDKMTILSIEGASFYTFGIDPDAIQDELKGGYENASIDLPKGFDDMLRIIKSAVQSGEIKRVPVSASDPASIDKDTRILKDSFLKWCKDHHYTCQPTEAKADYPQHQPKIVVVDHTNIQKTDTPSTKERESMLKIIIGMAIDGYGYNPKEDRSKFTGESTESLYNILVKMGISVDADTIRKYIKEAKELLPPK